MFQCSLLTLQFLLRKRFWRRFAFAAHNRVRWSPPPVERAFPRRVIGPLTTAQLIGLIRTNGTRPHVAFTKTVDASTTDIRLKTPHSYWKRLGLAWSVHLSILTSQNRGGHNTPDAVSMQISWPGGKRSTPYECRRCCGLSWPPPAPTTDAHLRCSWDPWHNWPTGYCTALHWACIHHLAIYVIPCCAVR